MRNRTGKECKKKDCAYYESYSHWSTGNIDLEKCMNCKWAFMSQFVNKAGKAGKAKNF